MGLAHGATELMVWGLVVHFVADWILQTDWMATCKMKRRQRTTTLVDDYGRVHPCLHPETDSPWWDRHPAAYVHAGIHTAGLAFVFPWPAAIALGVSHLLIDTRTPVVWLSRLVGQTQPAGQRALLDVQPGEQITTAPLYDIGTEVRIWTDQAWHLAALAIAALIVGAVS